MMQQILHNPKLAKLDLSSLVSAGSGGAYLPNDLRLAFQRKTTKLYFFIEGPGHSCHQWLVLIATLQDTGCLNV